MTYDRPSVASTLRGRVPTGYSRLDEALQGGFFAGSAILLSAPASSEVPILVRNFLKASDEVGLLICRSQSSAEAVSQPDDNNLKCMVCSEKPISPSRNLLPGKSIDNLTELNFQITETIGSVQPKRVGVEILSDILLRHKALQTRKWLNEFLEKLRSKGITIVVVLNPYMHANEEVQAVVDLFDGNLEIVEKEVEGQLVKFLRIKWMHGIEVTEKEFPVVDLVPEDQKLATQRTRPTHFKEPRWLTPLVDRTAELSKLQSAFKDALNNKSSIGTVHGEAGVGKTRLMRELAAFAQGKGAAILAGRASEEGMPYGPWVELLRQYIGQTPAEVLRRMLGSSASEFARLVPDIAAKIGTVPPSRPLAEEQDKIRLYETVTQFLISISIETPLLLLLDDMHWADQSSLGLLEHFVMSSGNLRVLTLAGYRTEDVSPDSPLSKTIMKLNRERVLESVSVKNLNNDETAELIKQTFGEESVSPEFADMIYNRTAGNPFFVEEVLRSLVEDGTVFRTGKGWDRKPIQEIILPESVKSLLKSRLTKLQPETLNLLTIASVIGSEFDFEVLRDVCQLEEEPTLQRLEAAFSAGLVQQIPRQKNIFTFSDNRIRELLLNNLIPIRRTKYHLRIAEAMEKVHSKNLETQAEAIAIHFSEGGDAERTIKYSLMAGDRNRTIHAYEQAVSDYKRALDLIELEGGRPEDKAAIFEKLGQSCVPAARYQESIRYFEQAVAIFEKLQDFKACARVARMLAWPIAYTKSFSAAVPLLRQALKYIKDTPESYEAADLYSELARCLGVMDKFDEANSWAQRALEAGEKSGNYAAVSLASAIMGTNLADTGHIDEGLRLLEKSLETAMTHSQHNETASALLWSAEYTYPRSLSKAREYAARWYDLAKRSNGMLGQANSSLMLSVHDWFAGDWARALDESRRAFDIQERTEVVLNAFVAEARRGVIHLGFGDLEQAEKYLQLAQAAQQQHTATKITVIVETNVGLGLLRLAQGREEEARTHFEKCVNAFKPAEFTTDPLLHIESLHHLTSIYAKEGRLEEARKMSEWARRLAETLKSDAGLAMASQAEASLLIASNTSKEAEQAYLKSLALWEKAGWPYYHAKALVGYSETIAQTNAEESRRRLEQAAEIFKKLGAKRDLKKAEAKLATHT